MTDADLADLRERARQFERDSHARREAKLRPARERRAAVKQLHADALKALAGMVRMAEAVGCDDRVIVAEAREVLARAK